jgi:hypothetical protein
MRKWMLVSIRDHDLDPGDAALRTIESIEMSEEALDVGRDLRTPEEKPHDRDDTEDVITRLLITDHAILPAAESARGGMSSRRLHTPGIRRITQ